MLSLLDHPGANGIPFDISDRGVQIAPVERIRDEPALPQISLPILPGVNDMSVFHMGFPEAPRETLFGPGDRDDMDMVIHKTEGPNGDAMLLDLASQQIQIKSFILFRKEYSKPPIPSLDHMVRAPRDYDSGYPRHDFLP
jgi:hypothetical protein